MIPVLERGLWEFPSANDPFCADVPDPEEIALAFSSSFR